MSKTYSNKSNAKRAAVAFCKADGLPENSFCLQQDVDGKWFFEVLTPVAEQPAPKAPRYKLHRRKPKAPVAAATPAAAALPAGTVPAHKDFQVYGKSQILKPVEVVHNFLNANGANLSRKQALFALAELGVNYATARTQYQRWFAANRSGK